MGTTVNKPFYRNKPIVLVAGGFDGLHSGHIALFKAAHFPTPLTEAKVGVILHTDAYLLRKKGYVFMPWDQRAAILENLKCVDFVVRVDDSDDTVCEALTRRKPDYFALGGDRQAGSTPESNLCHKLGIRMIFSIGGTKIESSSSLIENAKETRKKQWGTYTVLYNDNGVKVKILTLAPGKSISQQRHFKRTEHWYVTSGMGEAAINSQLFPLRPGVSLDVDIAQWHRIWNTSKEPLIIHEVQQGVECVEDDIERKEELE